MSMAAAGQSRNQVEIGKEESHRLKRVYRQKMPPAWLGHRPHVVLGRKLHHSVQHESWVGVGFSVRQTKTWWHGYWRGPTERDVLLILASDTEQGSLSDNRKSLITLGLGDGTADSEKTKVIPASQSWRSPAMQLLQGAK